MEQNICNTRETIWKVDSNVPDDTICEGAGAAMSSLDEADEIVYYWFSDKDS